MRRRHADSNPSYQRGHSLKLNQQHSYPDRVTNGLETQQASADDRNARRSPVLSLVTTASGGEQFTACGACIAVEPAVTLLLRCSMRGAGKKDGNGEQQFRSD